jgi:hypothetical protein
MPVLKGFMGEHVSGIQGMMKKTEDKAVIRMLMESDYRPPEYDDKYSKNHEKTAESEISYQSCSRCIYPIRCMTNNITVILTWLRF